MSSSWKGTQSASNGIQEGHTKKLRDEASQASQAHIDSKKENWLPIGDTNIKQGVETKNDKKGKTKTNLKEKDERERHGEVQTLERIIVATPQRSSFKSRERIAYYPKWHHQGH